MFDQAEMLRRRMKQARKRLGKTVAFVSAKEQIGKSIVAIQFARALSKLGNKVLLFDSSVKGNMARMMGDENSPSFSVFFEEEQSLRELIQKENDEIFCIRAGEEMISLLTKDTKRVQRFIDAFSILQSEYDYIVFDVDSLDLEKLTGLLLCVDDVIAITSADKTAVIDTYSLLKYYFQKQGKAQIYLLGNRIIETSKGEETIRNIQGAARKFLNKDIDSLGLLLEKNPYQIQDGQAQVYGASERNVENVITKYIHQSEKQPFSKKSFLQNFQGLYQRNDGA